MQAALCCSVQALAASALGLAIVATVSFCGVLHAAQPAAVPSQSRAFNSHTSSKKKKKIAPCGARLLSGAGYLDALSSTLSERSLSLAIPETWAQLLDLCCHLL